jgi:acyl-CoA synthetase (AMP-forming)/AMP-acid ligase II
VKSLGKKSARLTKGLNEAKQEAVNLKAENEKLQKRVIIAEQAEGLTTVSKAKFRKLAEEVTFTNVKDFTSKMKTLKESTGFKAPVKTGDVNKQTGNPEKLNESRQSSGNADIDAAADALARMTPREIK